MNEYENAELPNPECNGIDEVSLLLLHQCINHLESQTCPDNFRNSGLVQLVGLGFGWFLEKRIFYNYVNYHVQ